MIILTPVEESKTISIMPRISDFLYIFNIQNRVEYDGGVFESGSCIQELLDIVNNISVTVRKDGNNISETINDVQAVLNQNYVELSFPLSILEEGFGYTIECSVNGSLMYRDKIFSTTQTDFTKKHILAPDSYEQYGEDESNEYTVI